MTEALEKSTLKRWRTRPLEFIEQVLRDPETGKPFELFPAQRTFFEHAWKFDDSGHPLYPEQCFGAIKKTGKTGTAAMHGLTTTLVFGGRYAEGYCISNDFEQAQGRVFTAIRQIVESSPLLADEAVFTQQRITFPQTGAFIQALGSDYASAAGAHPCFVSADELWGFTSLRSRRLFDEMVPVPTTPISIRLITTHAGFEGESTLLLEHHARGMALPEIAPNLHAGDGQLVFWSCQPEAPWQDQHWLDQMRRTLPPNQYLRMIENKFVTSESSFFSMQKWDACVRPDVSPVNADLFMEIEVGIDASTKHDATAIMAVTYDRSTQMTRLVNHRVLYPSSKEPLDFEKTVETYLLDLNRRFQIGKILFDPYQMVATAQRLRKQGLPIEEFAQTTAHMTAASQHLFNLVESQALVLYPDRDMRLAASRTVGVETGLGMRITKQTSSHKIDSVIALAMACYATAQAEKEPYFNRSYDWAGWTPPEGTEAPMTAKEREDAEAAEYTRQRGVNHVLRHMYGNGGVSFSNPWGARRPGRLGGGI
jgi:phage terminase large subunit-like protein